MVNNFEYTAIIDVSHSFHKSFFIFKKWNDKADLKDSSAQGILMRKAVTDLFASINKLWHKPSDVYFCFDSRSWRKAFNSEYKSNREEKDDGFYFVINRLYDILLEKGYKALKVQNCESDDCISFLSQMLPGKKLIISGDEDMHQLINDEVVVWNNNLKKPIIYVNKKDEKVYFEFDYEKVEINPKLSLFKKIMLGCSGDNVSPLIDKKGIGEKTIEKFFNSLNDYKYPIQVELIERKVKEAFSYSRSDFAKKCAENIKLVDLSLDYMDFDNLARIENEVVYLYGKPAIESYKMESLLEKTEFLEKIKEKF